jgi:DEAD/DEAH box helicase domain-containing protein
MLTLQQAYEVKASITEYLKATFTFKDKTLNAIFLEFIEGMFKGPYVSLKLPFIKAVLHEEIPLEIQPRFLPFYHQIQAFKRLTTAGGNNPKPTLLTTGTGSGKTEAFLFPILDYCYYNTDLSGIKVIILYPMNALATDQAKRLAETIDTDSRLKGKIRAGLFIGESRQKQKVYPKVMGKDHIIENRDEIVSNPPDILLTNFKMLDFALMQAKYHQLWQHNFIKPELLKFIVLDELHTYEGAQGSDVANLIRRLKLKLNMPENHLCPVGTSATIGKGEESKSLLTDFATKVFGEDFAEDSIIEEHRVSPEVFFSDQNLRNFVPTIFLLKGSRLNTGEDFDVYIKNQLKVWDIDSGITPLALSEELKKYQIIKDLISICHQGILTIEELIRKLNNINKEFSAIPEWDESERFSPKETIIRSILSLISFAKTGSSERSFPFLYVQVQLWVRELSGLVRAVDEKPQFKWREDIDAQNSEKAFPAWFCRECGASGWLAVKADNKDQFDNDINDIYQKFFAHHKNVYLVTPYNEDNLCIEEYEPTDTLTDYLNKYSLTLHDTANENAIRIFGYRKLSGNYNLHICPACNSRNAINIVGTRISTLTSVSASQVLATDLDMSTEKERKILAFTNGVQDAAHQAGFMEARNYRFTFRTALQKVVNQLNRPVTLTELQEEFIHYWQNNSDEEGKNHLEAYYYKFFPTDHAADVDINRYKNKPAEFQTEFNHRIRWEIASEFGYNAIIGRTLEKTGSSATFFDATKLGRCFELMRDWLIKNALSVINKDEFLHFLFVFLHRLRKRGGVDHIYLNRFRTGRSGYYLITQNTNKQYFLIHNFGKNTRLPKLITDTVNRFGVFDLTTRTTSINWFHAYFSKAFPLAPNNTDLVNDFYTALLDLLATTEIGLFDEKTAEGVRNFALKTESLYVHNQVTTFECLTCGNRLSSTIQNASLIENASCMVYRCTGRYQQVTVEMDENYYLQVYNRGRAPRIYAADHTGLLDRKVREDLEIDYKTRPKFDSKNALVATSTLEMGIDIGSLNTAINTSIPPRSSNYLQRVGRAGRSSGSAIIISFVPNDAHDLYYFESPVEMMDGEINTPGCYLEAKEIIRRHFLAYCIDSWTKDDPERNVIPAIVLHLKLENLDLNDAKFFINKIIYFIKRNQKSLLESFKHVFKDKIAESVFEELAVQLHDHHLFAVIKKTFGDLKEELIILRKKLKDINDDVKARQLDVNDPEYLELRREHRNIVATIGMIRKRQVIEHMINEGLLPNYAFPETGVTLKSQVSRRKDDNPKSYQIKSLEVVRPARSALRELIPTNYFYTQGYKVQISGVNVVNWKDEVIDYRFCSDCDNITEDIPPVLDRCPKCGSETWRSALNTHKVLRMKTVNSFDDEQKAKIDDKSDEREKKFSRITRHFNFDPKSIQGSWVMLRIPFGIEFIKSVQIVELNAGLHDDRLYTNDDLVINGQEVPKNGYIVCKYCGKVITSTRNERHEELQAKDYHFGYCKNKSHIYQLKPDDFFEEIFFYRRMNTEAIKILLPVQEFNTESAVKLFKAGISFGLKKYFRGNPDHLEIAEYSEYNQQTQRHDRFLVVFDTIPGGTGYLSKIFNKDEFNFILKEAYINIRDCKCQLHGKDGCYNCIYTYGNQFEREELSRSRAEKLFEKIVRLADQWDYLPGGLGKVTNSGKIEESELEERFIKVLSNYYNDETRPDYSFSEKTEDGITHYIMELKNSDRSLIFEIKPQIELGPADGIRYTTIADFLITCTGQKEKDGKYKSALAKYKQIAVYLDGYQYHASEENNRFIGDIEKRKALIESGKFYVWTLTWNDLELFENESDNIFDALKTIFEHDLPLAIRQQINQQHPLITDLEKSLSACRNNMDRFIWLLEHYYLENLSKVLCGFTFYYQSRFPQNYISRESARTFISNHSTKFSDFHLLINDSEGFMYIDLIRSCSFFETRILQELKTLQHLSALFIKSKEKQYEKKDWEYFWQIINIIQFSLDQFKISYFEDMEPVSSEEMPEDDRKIYENFDEKYHTLVEILLEHDIAFNNDDYFYLKDSDGMIIAEAFLGLPDHKIVVDPLDIESKKQFEDNSYKVYSLENFDINNI